MFSKNTQIPNFMKILPVDVKELCHADIRMDWREANSHDFKLLPRSECCIIAFG
jgi:hypothetical protein